MYDITIQYRPGTLHSNADALSSIPCKHCARQEKLDSEGTEKKGVTHTSCRKLTLRSHIQICDDDIVEESPQSMSLI